MIPQEFFKYMEILGKLNTHVRTHTHIQFSHPSPSNIGFPCVSSFTIIYDIVLILFSYSQSAPFRGKIQIKERLDILGLLNTEMSTSTKKNGHVSQCSCQVVISL